MAAAIEQRLDKFRASKAPFSTFSHNTVHLELYKNVGQSSTSGPFLVNFHVAVECDLTEFFVFLSLLSQSFVAENYS